MRNQKTKPTPERTAATLAAFREYAPELHRFIARRMRNPDNAADLTQEIFERYLQLPSPESVRDAQAFLYGIASNLVRELRYREGRSLIAFDSHVVDAAAEHHGPAAREDFADHIALEQELKWAIAKLPAAHRAVLLLVKRDGLSYSEVAQQTGLTLATVTNYVSQARARVKMLLKSQSG